MITFQHVTARSRRTRTATLVNFKKLHSIIPDGQKKGCYSVSINYSHRLPKCSSSTNNVPVTLSTSWIKQWWTIVQAIWYSYCGHIYFLSVGLIIFLVWNFSQLQIYFAIAFSHVNKLFHLYIILPKFVNTVHFHGAQCYGSTGNIFYVRPLFQGGLSTERSCVVWLWSSMCADFHVCVWNVECWETAVTKNSNKRRLVDKMKRLF